MIEITLYDFLYVLNQDEDMWITITDYLADKVLYCGWKQDYNKKHNEWFVQYFVTVIGGLEITIVKNKKDLD